MRRMSKICAKFLLSTIIPLMTASAAFGFTQEEIARKMRIEDYSAIIICPTEHGNTLIVSVFAANQYWMVIDEFGRTIYDEFNIIDHRYAGGR